MGNSEQNIILYQKAKLFGKAKSTINEHIGNIYKEQEKSLTTQKFGNSEFQQKAP